MSLIDSQTWASLKNFWHGTLFGIILTCSVQVLIVKYVIKQMKSRKSGITTETSQNNSDQPIPPSISEFLLNKTKPKEQIDAENISRGFVETSDTETVDWLNVWIHRFWVELMNSSLFAARLKIKVLKKVEAKMASLSMLQGITFTSLDFGSNPPVFHGVRYLKYHSQDREVTLELDCTYQGGLSIGVEVELTTPKVTIPAVITLKGLAGKLRIRVPSRIEALHMDVSFAEDPGAELQVVSAGISLGDNDYLKDTLTNYLNKKVSTLFAEAWTVPTYRFFELPLVNRKVTDPEKIPILVGVSRTAEGQGHLWMSGEYTQKEDVKESSSSEVVDVLADTTFDLDTLVSVDNYEPLVSNLTRTFVQLAKEDTKVVSKGPEAWKTVKEKENLIFQRKKILLPAVEKGSVVNSSEFSRAIIVVDIPADHVFDLLKKNFVKHVAEVSCTDGLQFDKNVGLKKLNFKEKSATVLESIKTPDKLNAWMMICRSVASETTSSASVNSINPPETVNICGILIEPLEKTTQITIVTQFSSKKLDITYESAKQLKTYLEDLVSISSATTSTLPTGARKPQMAKSLLAPGSESTQLKSLAGATKILGAKAKKWWSTGGHSTDAGNTVATGKIVAPEFQTESEEVHVEWFDTDSIDTTIRLNPPSPGKNPPSPSKSPKDEGASPSEAISQEPPQMMQDTPVLAKPFTEVPFQFHNMIGRQPARLEIVWKGSNDPMEFVFEYRVASHDALQFGLFFKPKESCPYLSHMIESPFDASTKCLMTLSPTLSDSQAVRGRFSTSALPKGSFILVFDNLYKPTDKPLRYKARVQPITLGQTYSQEWSGTILLRSRSIYRVEVLNFPGMSREKTTLQWSFSTNGQDVGFGIFYHPVEPQEPLDPEKPPPLPPREKKAVVVVPTVKCNSQEDIQGSVSIQEKYGVYTIIFDNTSSLMTNKNVTYKIGTISR